MASAISGLEIAMACDTIKIVYYIGHRTQKLGVISDVCVVLDVSVICSRRPCRRPLLVLTPKRRVGVNVDRATKSLSTFGFGVIFDEAEQVLGSGVRPLTVS